MSVMFFRAISVSNWCVPEKWELHFRPLFRMLIYATKFSINQILDSLLCWWFLVCYSFVGVEFIALFDTLFVTLFNTLFVTLFVTMLRVKCCIFSLTLWSKVSNSQLYNLYRSSRCITSKCNDKLSLRLYHFSCQRFLKLCLTSPLCFWSQTMHVCR